MDANNYLLCKQTGIPRERCIGFGGQLDSARFALALRDPGHHRVLLCAGRAWRAPGAGLLHALPQRSPYPCGKRSSPNSAGASMDVIKGKGGTVFGPALHIAHLTRMVLTDARELVICSSVLEGEYGISGCSLGVPVRIGKDGIGTIEEWHLDRLGAGEDEPGRNIRCGTLPEGDLLIWHPSPSARIPA